MRGPNWRNIAQAKLPVTMAEVLVQQASLTTYLTELTQQAVTVAHVVESFGTPTTDEAKILNHDEGEPLWVREAVLCFDYPRVFARSLFPYALVQQDPRFAQLSHTPLGPLLFGHKDCKRGPIQVARFKQGFLYDKACAFLQATDKTVPTQLWARRSVFQISGIPCLVQEVFLPSE